MNNWISESRTGYFTGLAGWVANLLSKWRKGWLFHVLMGWLIGWLIVCLKVPLASDCLTDQLLTGWFTGKLTGCVIELLAFWVALRLTKQLSGCMN
jgi:uncharacterized membrane protein YeaQ/YmgE (transglycosylase-associated protein family)